MKKKSEKENAILFAVSIKYLICKPKEKWDVLFFAKHFYVALRNNF
jgi:hypothetical protein